MVRKMFGADKVLFLEKAAQATHKPLVVKSNKSAVSNNSGGEELDHDSE
jgi:hypothetical protein